jgi:HAD superfamily hydrolase (TIGR01509 family)
LSDGLLRAVLFDMDGLLVDSEPLWFEAECAVMATMGGSWTRADQLELTGGSLEHSVGYMRARALRPAEPALVGRWLLDTMATLIAERGVPLMPGAAGLLAELAAAGIPMALVTSAQRQIMDAVIARSGLAFGTTVCAEDVSHGKPDPEPYQRAAALLGQPPAGCVALEDSPRGIAAAQAAGCPVIAVPSVPLPAALGTARPGRAIVTSLQEVDLARIRQLVAVSAAHGR